MKRRAFERIRSGHLRLMWASFCTSARIWGPRSSPRTPLMELDVHLEGVDGPIGQLSRSADSGVAFQYALAELPYPLSLALPVQEAPFRDVATRG